MHAFTNGVDKVGHQITKMSLTAYPIQTCSDAASEQTMKATAEIRISIQQSQNFYSVWTSTV